MDAPATRETVRVYAKQGSLERLLLEVADCSYHRAHPRVFAGADELRHRSL